MGDAEVEGSQPGHGPTEGDDDAREIADGGDQNAQAGNEIAPETTENATENSAIVIDNDAPATDTPNENKTPGVVGSVNEGTLDAAETHGENGVDKASPEDGTSRIGTGAESCVEGSADTDDVYRRVREMALEAINAVRTVWGMGLKH